MDGWFRIEKLGRGVTRFTEPHVNEFYRANLYRIAGRDFDIQLDFGVGVASLAAVSPADGHPVLAIASHAHVDHIGSFHDYARRAGHRLEADVFARLDDAGTVESWFRAEADPVARAPVPGWSLADYRLMPAPLTEHLDEGDVIDTGDRRFRILHLPGHSPGSIGLLDEHNGEFFSADAIYDDELVDDVPTADIPAYLATMQRLSELDIAIGHGGHGPDFDMRRMHEIARAYIDLRG
jgi:glyoxylase-like metal-dependent hydrolase (beta-lactamase superfamily II)